MSAGRCDGHEVPAVSFRPGALDVRGDGTVPSSYIRGWRQQHISCRCDRRGLADEEHRRIDGDGEHLHHDLCGRDVGGEAASSWGECPKSRGRFYSDKLYLIAPD